MIKVECPYCNRQTSVPQPGLYTCSRVLGGCGRVFAAGELWDEPQACIMALTVLADQVRDLMQSAEMPEEIEHWLKNLERLESGLKEKERDGKVDR